MADGWWGGLAKDPVVHRAMQLGASQDPDELGLALGLVRALGPAVVVEIGCDRGGTLYAWRAGCPDAAVFGITSPDNGYEAGGSGLPLEPHGAVVRFGDSHDPASRDWLLGQLACCHNPTVAHAIDVLVIDGDHTAAGVVADVAMYGPLVRPGGLILIHDIHSGHDPRVQVPRVWQALRAEYDAREIDGGGPGWGVITVREGDKFAREEPVA